MESLRFLVSQGFDMIDHMLKCYGIAVPGLLLIKARKIDNIALAGDTRLFAKRS